MHADRRGDAADDLISAELPEVTLDTMGLGWSNPFDEAFANAALMQMVNQEAARWDFDLTGGGGCPPGAICENFPAGSDPVGGGPAGSDPVAGGPAGLAGGSAFLDGGDPAKKAERKAERADLVEPLHPRRGPSVAERGREQARGFQVRADGLH